MTHTCPIPGCTAEVKLNHLMCWGHWVRVPKKLQRIIKDGFTTRTKEYEDAVHRAIEFVTRKDSQ